MHRIDLGGRKLRGGSPWGFLVQFQTETIQKSIMYVNAYKQIFHGVKVDKFSVLNNPKTQKAIRQVVILHIIGAMMEVVSSAYRDMMNNDDDELFDEKYWDIKSLVLSTLMGPLRGLPIFGDLFSNFFKSSSLLGEQRKSATAFGNLLKIALTDEEATKGEIVDEVFEMMRVHWASGVLASGSKQLIGLYETLSNDDLFD
jgi:hypothetical protein